MGSKPSSILRMINTLQVYRYLLLLNVTLTYRVSSILQGFDPLSLIPNISIHILDDSGIEMNKKYKDFGVETSDFILNTGRQFLILGVLVTIYMVSKILSRLKLTSKGDQLLKRVLTRILSMFKYGMFIGFWIGGYLDFMFLSGLNLIHFQSASSHEIASIVLSAIFMVKYT
jgi:hypothetical protein